ncbi:MAG: hypothetical protein AMS22_15750 [Thiotrichales bacterium SG8_50]|nr:MAG: hypothetical protein AMS22_15750 [Thiotrichales bacterium SG8_50]
MKTEGVVFSNIVTEQLILRRLELSDAEGIYNYRSDSEVSRYQCWAPGSVAEIQSFIEDQLKLEPDTPGAWFQLAITIGSSGKLIGDLGLHTLVSERRQAEIGITLAPTFQGQGYATEALKGALEYLFVNLKKHRVIGSVDPRNLASIALMERVGMRKEAHMVESLWIKGNWADDLIYAILEREWATRKAERADTSI